MKKKKTCVLIVTQVLPNKPQISSVPGVSVKERDRYQVVRGNEILGTRLTIDEALKIVRGAR